MGLGRDFTPRYVEGAVRVPFTNNSAAALSEGEGFNITSGTVTVLADANTVGIFGVACADVAVNDKGWCWVTGIFEVATAGTVDFALGGAVYSAGAKTFDLGTQADVPIGHVVDIDPANGATTVLVGLASQYLDRTAHA